MAISRSQFTDLNDSQLLAQCEVDTYRASGPGGQKRNKTSSAVRIRHPATGLLVIAEESRSQHENRAKALKRLRHAFVLKMRQQLAADEVTPESLAAKLMLRDAKTRSGKLEVGRKDRRFWPLVGLVLDVLAHMEARTADTATALGISTGILISFLKTEPKVWEQANQMREEFGQKPLR